MSSRPVAELLATLKEPTRIRILNCLSRAPLSISDLAAILPQPESAVSETIDALESLGIVRSVPVEPYVLYTLALLSTRHDRLLRAALDALRTDPAAQQDRALARQRSRARLNTRARPALMDAS